MSEKKINLEEIMRSNIINYLLIKNIDSDAVFEISNKIIKDDWYVKKAILEFGKQLLELAAENATTKNLGYNCTDMYSHVNKQSILDTIKQVE